MKLRDLLEVTLAFIVMGIIVLFVVGVLLAEVSVFVAGVFVVWGIPLPIWLKILSTLGIASLAFDRITSAYEYVKRR